MTDHSPRRTSVVSAAAALAMIALLLGGCQRGADEPRVASVSGSQTAAPPADREAQLSRYRDCLTQHGVTLLDTPTAEGLPQVDKANTDPKVVGEAQAQCRQFVPSGGDATRPSAQDLETSRRYAACLRQHGVPDYPDPDPVTGDPRIDDDLGARLKADPKMATATQACAEFQPGGKGTVGG
ncbi:hypothetical protein K7640_05715 [Micromonospora sp. PLK6-60]|uniref:hypothetical protein n=1 Tax=Micromonospora sp. PLK6-60 TaxID=2873383 RepID=UPI001CA7ACE8|nr:hypothetical protein [Micromonospora sp. PLK6-60]MBY8871338.1 hypothetical protein [Micromonospora sp. PLK6-60]